MNPIVGENRISIALNFEPVIFSEIFQYDRNLRYYLDYHYV